LNAQTAATHAERPDLSPLCRPDEDEHRREHERLSVARGEDVLEVEARNNGEGQDPGKMRLGGTSAGREGGHQRAGPAGGRASQRGVGQCMQDIHHSTAFPGCRLTP
jgi:hypothetical protein